MKETGGPAFGSYHRAGEIVIREGGLTIRDWFAGQALKGFLESGKGVGWGNATDLAKRSYEFADAMLKEREK